MFFLESTKKLFPPKTFAYFQENCKIINFVFLWNALCGIAERIKVEKSIFHSVLMKGRKNIYFLVGFRFSSAIPGGKMKRFMRIGE